VSTSLPVPADYSTYPLKANAIIKGVYALSLIHQTGVSSNVNDSESMSADQRAVGCVGG
jgi:hypothetical protein